MINLILLLDIEDYFVYTIKLYNKELIKSFLLKET